jgi:hypothetical protein
MSESEQHNANNVLVVRRKLPLRDRVAASRSIVLLLFTALVIGALGGMTAVALGVPLGALEWPMITVMMGLAMAVIVGAAAVSVAAASTARINKKRKKLLGLQKKLMEEPAEDVCNDLHTLVQGYLDLKEFQVADHYSALLLKQSALAPEQRATKLAEIVTTIGCWASTPEYHEKPNYWLVWLFESRGQLTLTPNELQYNSKRISFVIDLADIRDISIAHHPRWLKPITLEYLVLTFLSDGQEHDIFLTPSFAQTDSISQVNSTIHSWVDIIKAAQQRRVGARAIERMRAQIPGVGSSSEQKV